MNLYDEVLRVRRLTNDQDYVAQRRTLVALIGERAYLAIAAQVSRDLHAASRGAEPLANWELDILNSL